MVSVDDLIVLLKEMSFSFTLIASLVLASYLVAEDGGKSPLAYEGTSKHTIEVDRPDITKKGKWGEWKFWYIFKGTRSEGLHGSLKINDEDKLGKTIGEKFAVNGHTYVWYGRWDKREQLFSKSGWFPAELKILYPSWQVKPDKSDQKAKSAEQAVPPKSDRAGG